MLIGNPAALRRKRRRPLLPTPATSRYRPADPEQGGSTVSARIVHLQPGRQPQPPPADAPERPEVCPYHAATNGSSPADAKPERVPGRAPALHLPDRATRPLREPPAFVPQCGRLRG